MLAREARVGEYSQINAARYSRVAGTGSDLPPLRLTNNDLVEMLAKRGVETSDDWIVERTGIRARHFVADDVHASDLATAAAQRALEAAGCSAADIDLIIVATSTPDMIFPSTASIVQRKLGVYGCAAFDVQAVCSGFIYALSVADAMIKAGSARRALIIGAEVFSRLLDFDDRTTCVLFGDGAGAVVLELSETPGVVATKLHADGRHLEILCTPGTVNGGKVFGDPLLKMDGPAVFKLAVGVLGDVANEVLEAGRTHHFRRRLARAAPGEHPYHAEHGPQAQAARGPRGGDGGRTRQHVGRLHPAGARRRHPLGPDPAGPAIAP